MSKVDELLFEVRKQADRTNLLEKTIGQLASQKNDAVDVLRKAVSASGPARRWGGNSVPVTVGFDGGDTMALLEINAGVRQKACGWGQFLKANFVACGGDGAAVGWRDGNVHKALETMGATPIQKTALAEGSGATGGYTVPPQFYAELMRLVAEESFVRSRCTTIPMTTRSMFVPAVNHGSAAPSAGTSNFFGGIAASWQPEAASINESEPTFQQIELVARDLVFHTIASNQLLADNAVALDTLLTTMFTEAMAWFIDYYILNGNGANQPLGIINAPAAFVYNRDGSSVFGLGDAAGMFSHMLPKSLKSSIWVMNPSVMPKLITMADSTNGRLVWLNQFPGTPGTEGGGAASALPMTLLGRPIYWTEKVPDLGTKGDVMLLDLSQYLVGDRMALQIETSPHVKFLNNQMVWRIIARWDGQPWLKNTIYAASGTHQYAPFVILDA